MSEGTVFDVGVQISTFFLRPMSVYIVLQFVIF